MLRRDRSVYSSWAEIETSEGLSSLVENGKRFLGELVLGSVNRDAMVVGQGRRPLRYISVFMDSEVEGGWGEGRGLCLVSAEGSLKRRE